MKATVLIVALAVAASTATAGPIFTGLFNTGVDSTGFALAPNNAVDTHYIASPIGTAETYYYSAPWVPDTPGAGGANWISTYANGGVLTNVGTYKYTQTLTAQVTGSVTISGAWATDNCGTIKDFAGNPVATLGGGVLACTSPSSAFTAGGTFSFAESVVSGMSYTLDFEVYNSGGPTGLLVENLSASCAAGSSCTAATPEPSSVLLTLTGVGLLGIGMIRRGWIAIPRR